MKPISFSAPAKIHLLGEHAVVYGKPAIISAINLRLYLELTPTPKSHRDNSSSLVKLQKAVENAIKKTYKLKKLPHYQAQIESEFPVGAGLGASAAISATLTAALLKLLKIDFRKETSQADKQQIYDIALSGEKAIHGNPSGSDLAAIVFGGTLWFRKETPEISLMSPLPSVALAKEGNLFLIDSGKPAESTGVMVAKVAKLSAATKKKYFDQLESLTCDLGSGGDLKQIFKEANQCLIKLGVVSPSAQKLIKQIEKSGGAAKITGAGGYKTGSGMIIAHVPHPEKLKGLELIKIKLAQEGLRSEN